MCDERDILTAPKVAVVNELFATKYFGSTNIVGRTFHMEAEAGKPESVIQIIGVVRNTKYYELREDFRPIAFLPVAQEEKPGPGATFVLRVQGSPSELVSAIKSSIAQVNPVIGIEFRSFSAQLEESLLARAADGDAVRRLRIAGRAAGHAGTVWRHLVHGDAPQERNRRAHRAGRRSGRVVQLVLRETAVLLAFGLVAGVICAVWMGRAATSMLFGVKPYDPDLHGGSDRAAGRRGTAGQLRPRTPRRCAAADDVSARRVGPFL